MPRYLKPDEVDKLLDASWAPTPVGRRNYAMLMVLARLGLRAPEVIAIQLDDIVWRGGTILIRGKGKCHDRMPLPDDLGKAIVDYIKNGRRGRSRTLFVSRTPPHKPFGDAQILNTALKQAFVMLRPDIQWPSAVMRAVFPHDATRIRARRDSGAREALTP